MARRKKRKTKEINIFGEHLNINIPISKCSEVNLSKVDKEFIYFDKLNDGTWRMVYTKNSIIPSEGQLKRNKNE